VCDVVEFVAQKRFDLGARRRDVGVAAVEPSEQRLAYDLQDCGSDDGCAVTGDACGEIAAAI
jgi:hypothetical protein